MSGRADIIDTFLDRVGWAAAERRPLAGDASFRRYIRLVAADGAQAMLMDAPPPQEDVGPFLRIARHLRALGFSAPAILAADEAAGLLLLEDLGDQTFTRIIAEGGNERSLYELAVDVLIVLHRNPEAASVAAPPYDDGRLIAEAALFVDWYFPAVTGRPARDSTRGDYVALWRAAFPAARAVPNSLVLRDYHVDNLMRLDGRDGIAACGLLDFQDAVIGPVSYDFVSLVEDARRDIAPPLISAMVERYLAAFPALDPTAFNTSCAVLGAQRHAKVLGIFTRLDRRDGKPHYLRHIPRLWRLIERDLADPAMADLRAWFDAEIPPALRIAPEPSGGVS